MAHKRPTAGYSAGSEGSFAAGSEVELPDHEAIALIEKGYAIPVAASPVEKAVKARGETRKKR